MKYIVGSNLPGELPDNTPDEFDTFEDAQAALKTMINETADALSMGDEPDPFVLHERDLVLDEVDTLTAEIVHSEGILHDFILGDWVHWMATDDPNES